MAKYPIDVLLEQRSEYKDGHRLWTGPFGHSGYGLVWYNKRQWRVHRLVWTLMVGQIPDGLWVLHHCDIKRCFALPCLYTGTPTENQQDASRRGRIGRENHWAAVVTADIVQEIRREYANGGITQAKLGEVYGLSTTAIWNIVNEYTWKDIDATFRRKG